MKKDGQQVGTDQMPQVGVPEEPGHVDQGVVMKGSHLVRTNLEEARVFCQGFDAPDDHAAGNPPPDRLRFVVAKVKTRGTAQSLQEFFAGSARRMGV